MLKKLMILLILPGFLCANNIGLCGGKHFLKRQKLVDRLVMQLKSSSDSKNIQKRIIKEYGYIGIENLIRYHEEELKDVFISLLKHKNFYVQYKTLYALRRYHDIDLQILKPYLKSTNLYLKDMALSFYTENGKKKDIPVLNRVLKNENNIYIKSSLEYLKNKWDKSWTLLFPDFHYYWDKSNLKKVRYYKSGDSIENYKQKYSQFYFKNENIPVADSFVPPIIGYLDEFIFKGRRISFGVGGHKKHAGDDCGWFREGASVYAIGAGVIRLIHHSPDWGFLMVIEHKTIKGHYLCSIYGHLSKKIYKRAGDIVKKGEKIGTIGLSYSIENGGYGAHLHFGICKGRWLKSKYDFAHQVSIIMDGEEKRVKNYNLNEDGLEMDFEDGVKIKVSDNTKKDLNSSLFWLKGYTFSKDLDRFWLDPQEFLKQ